MLLAGTYTYTGMNPFTPPKVLDLIEGGIGAFIIIVVKLVQSQKALLPMLVRPSGKVSEVRLVQPWKAKVSMFVKPSGKVIEDRPVQFWKD